MAQLAVGIDIGDDLLSAVLVTGAGRDAQVLTCGHHFYSKENPLAEELAQLIAKLGTNKTDRCVVGISLSGLSLRNLSLPFTEEKKIQQVLPFELEEQLLLPAEEQIIATLLAPADANGTKVIAAAAEKEFLKERLEAVRSAGLEPNSISPALYTLTDRLCRTKHTGESFLLLHGDLAAVQLVLARQGEIVFMRRLAWPDSVFTQALFTYQQSGGLDIPDGEEIDEAVNSISALILHSLEYFAAHYNQDFAKPEYFVLTGPLQLCPNLLPKMVAALGLPGETCDLVRDGAATLSKAAFATWQAALYDTALALALQQRGRRGKESGLNFRQGELALSHHLLYSNKQVTALAATVGLVLLLGLGWLFMTNQRLEQRATTLSNRMDQIFQESFPGVKPGPDPFAHMKSRLISVDGSTASIPLFAEEKRILSLLADISARIPASIQLRVSQLVIDQNSVVLKGSTDAFNNVNRMQTLLSQSDRYVEAKIASAVKGKKDEGILFDIRLQLKTKSGS